MRTKVLLGYIIIAAIIFSCLVPLSLALTRRVPVAYAETETVYESESNNSKDTANEIAVNTNVSGKLSDKSDKDWYKFTTTQNGYFNVSFEHTLLSSNQEYWCLYIYDESGVSSIDGVSGSYAVKGNENYTTSNFGIPAGTYYIRINVYYYHSTNDYKFKVNFTPSGEWETENNNDMNSANEIALNTPLYGSLSNRSDKDWYKFTTTQNGYFNVSFEHTLLSSNQEYWCLYIYDESGVSSIDGVSGSYAVKGNENYTTSNFGIPAGTYYIRINVYYYHSTNDYKFKVNFTPSGEWETENNNSKENADEIDVNKTIHAALSSSNDADWYRFNISASSQISVTLNHEAINSTRTYWRIYVYDNTGVRELLSWGRRGDTESASTDFINVSSGVYYIKITRYDNYSDVDYSICVVEKHDHKGIWETTVEPTCTDKGVSTKTCTICGQVETRDIDPLGHSFDDGKVIKKATPAQKGEIRHTCTICGEQYIEKDGHLLWVIPVACICGIILLIGAINYIRIMIKTRP